MSTYVLYAVIVVVTTVIIDTLQFRASERPGFGKYTYAILLLLPFFVIGYVLWQNHNLRTLEEELVVQKSKPERMPDSEYAEIYQAFFKEKTGYDIVIVPYKKSIGMYTQRIIGRYEDNGNLVWYLNLSGLRTNDTLSLVSLLGDYSNVHNAFVTTGGTNKIEHAGFCLIMMISYIAVLQNDMNHYLMYSHDNTEVSEMKKDVRRQVLVSYWRNRSFKVYSEPTVLSRKMNYEYSMKSGRFVQQFSWLLSGADYTLYKQGKVRLGYNGRIFRASNVNDPADKNKKPDTVGRVGDYIVRLDSMVKQAKGKSLPANLFLSTRIYKKFRTVFSPELKYRNLRIELAGRINERMKPYDKNFDARSNIELAISSVKSDLKGARYFMFWHCVIACFFMFLTGCLKFSDWLSQYREKDLIEKAEREKQKELEEAKRKKHLDDVGLNITRAEKLGVESLLSDKAEISEDDLLAEKRRLDRVEEQEKKKKQSERHQLLKEQTKKEQIDQNARWIVSLKQEIDDHAESSIKAELMRELTLVEEAHHAIGQKKPKKIAYRLEKITERLLSKK